VRCTPHRGFLLSSARSPALAVAAAIVLVLTAACGGSDNSAAGSGTGTSNAAASKASAAAARRLDQAASAMRQVAGYRFVATVGTNTSQVQLTGEFEAPDRVHENIDLAGRAPVEVVFAGNQAYVKDAASGAWRNRVQAPATTSTDVRAAFAALTKAQSVKRHGGATYTFDVPADAALALVGTTAATSIPGVARTDGNEISTLTYRPTIAGTELQVTITYTDVNRAPAVSVPTAS
jgi:hypothetical protein